MNRKSTLKSLLIAAIAIGFSFTSKAQLLTEGFEGATFPPAGWTTIDADGNAVDNWAMIDNSNTYSPAIQAFEGNQFAGSLSWLNNALNPDNWLITPQIAIPDASYILTFRGKSNWGQPSGAAGDHLGVFVSTTGTAQSDFTMIFEQDFATQTWENIQLSLAAYAGQSIYIAFRHFNCTDLFVMGLDDVQVKQPDAYDLVLNEVIWGIGGAWGYIPYYFVPTTQVNTVEFSGVVNNNGFNDQADVEFKVNSGTYNGTTGPKTIVSQDTDTIDVVTGFNLPSSLGNNVLDFSVTSSATDAVPANNTLPSQTISVTATEFGMDKGVTDGNVNNQGNGYEVGNVFNISQNQTLTAAKINIGAQTTANTQIYIKLYEIDTTVAASQFLDFFVEIYQSQNMHTVVAADYNTWLTIPFESVQNLVAGKSYCLMVGSMGGATPNDLVMNTAGNSPAGFSCFFDWTDGKMYYVTRTPMVRMEFAAQAPTISSSDPDFQGCIGQSITLTSSYNSGNTWSNGATTQSIDVTDNGTYSVTNGGLTSNAVSITFVDCTSLIENGVNALSIYPNPSNGQFTVKADDLTSYNTIYLVDALGRKVQSWKINSNTMNVKIKNIQSGSYSLIVSGKNGQIIQKLMID